MPDFQHQLKSSTSYVNWCLNDCNCFHSVCEDNQRPWMFNIPICDQQNKSGTQQCYTWVDLRQKICIANSLTKFLENCNPDNWSHIPGKMNPADHGTRGLTPSDILKLWLETPTFWAHLMVLGTSPRTVIPTYVLHKRYNFRRLSFRFKKSSKWSRLLNATRMVIQAMGRFKARLWTRRQNDSPETSNTDNFESDGNRARNYLITMSQNEFFQCWREAISRKETSCCLSLFFL